ncbi:hypothetical protein KFL_015890010, partial [Klebsormidium nitens]
YGLGFGIRN